MFPRHDNTDRQPHHRRFVLAALFCVAALAGCGVEPQANLGSAGSAQVSLKVTMPQNVAAVAPPPTSVWATVQRWVWGTDAWAASVNEITGLIVRVTGPGIGTPISSPRVPVSGAVSGLVIPVTLEVPVGEDRVFAVAAVDAANRPIFQGQSEPVTLTADQPETVAIQLTDTTIRIITTTLPDGTEDRSYTASLQAERGSGVTWTVQAGELPPGVRLDATTGALLGTSTTAGVFPVTIRVTDAVGLFDEAQVTIRINPAPLPPRITTTTLPNGTVGMPYRATLVAVDGTGAPTWSRIAGALPNGLNLNSATGVITGTPTKEGTASFTVRATDSIPLSDEQALAITINPAPVPPTITTTTLPDGTTQARYSARLVTTGGTGAVTWSVVVGTLPDNLFLNRTTGAITGTPTTNGTFRFTVRATDTMPLSDEKALTITIKEAPKPPVITSTTLPGGKVGDAYNAQLTATSTNGAVRWSSPDFPAGFTLGATTGLIAGTPTTKGTVDFTIRATDAAGLFDEQALFIQISEQPKPPIITTTTLPGGTVNVTYRAQLTATSTNGAVTWSVSAGTLPPGLTLTSATGVITGTPTTRGTFRFTVRATDNGALSDEQALTLTIQDPIRPPEITTDSLPEGRVGEVYSAQLTATSPNGAVTWSAGSLPDGLKVNGTSGVISGTPTVVGDFTVTVRATDPLNRVDDQTLSLVIRGNPPRITTTSLPGGTVNVAYRAQLTATGGTGAVTWSVSAGTLPPGLTLTSATGVITGTPTTKGTFSVTVRATDTILAKGEKGLTITIQDELSQPVITTTALPGGRVGDAYSAKLRATSTNGAVIWSVRAGALPSGLSLNATTGALTGTPTAAGTFGVTVRATDPLTLFDEQAFSIQISNRQPPPVITTETLPAGTIFDVSGEDAAFYSKQLEATGGTEPYTWSVTGGNLPDGLDLNTATGNITGFPEVEGSSKFDIGVKDANGLVASKAFAIEIYERPLTEIINCNFCSIGILPDGFTGVPYKNVINKIENPVTLFLNGGLTPFTWSVEPSLPNGLTLDAGEDTVTITGIPTVSTKEITYKFTVVDKVGDKAEISLTLTINGCCIN